MTPLLLSLTLTAPAHPPGYPPPPPVVVVRPIVLIPPRPPVVVIPAPRPPVVVFPATPAPAYYPPPAPQPVVPAAPQAITLGDFSRYFTPTPGKHDVWVVHPVTRQPVQVCFTLPPGKLRDFEVDRRSIRFAFAGGRGVEIDFRGNGTVRVEYFN